MCADQVEFISTKQTRHCVVADEHLPQTPYDHNYWTLGDEGSFYHDYMKSIMNTEDWKDDFLLVTTLNSTKEILKNDG